jgi:hypothetical protein
MSLTDTADQDHEVMIVPGEEFIFCCLRFGKKCFLS